MRIHKLVFASLILISLVSCSDENDKQPKETSVLEVNNFINSLDFDNLYPKNGN